MSRSIPRGSCASPARRWLAGHVAPFEPRGHSRSSSCSRSASGWLQSVTHFDRRILARAYEESQKLRGAGEAEATTIYAQNFNEDPEFYAFVRSLEAYDRLLGADTTLVLSSESDLFRYLNSHRAADTSAQATSAP